MAFYKCPKCEGWVADHMESCPKCNLSLNEVITNSKETVGESANRVSSSGSTSYSNVCTSCNKGNGIKTIQIDDKPFCSTCAKRYIDSCIKEIKITTTHHIDGYRIIDYIDIETVEVVLGTGFFSEFTSEISDFFGARSSAFEQKMQNAKKTAFNRLKYLAYERKGNAVVGIDIDYTEFTGNRIGVIVSGTIVKIEIL